MSDESEERAAPAPQERFPTRAELDAAIRSYVLMRDMIAATQVGVMLDVLYAQRAALAGFTAEDVAALRRAVERFAGEYGDLTRLESLASRIAALLPPEEPK